VQVAQVLNSYLQLLVTQFVALTVRLAFLPQNSNEELHVLSNHVRLGSFEVT
jgi:hypothetical protein